MNYSVTVSARNDISFQVKSVTVRAIHRVANLALVTSHTNPSYPGNIHVSIEPSALGSVLNNVFLAWNFNEETKFTTFVREMSSNAAASESHVFDVGAKYVTVNISNSRSFQVMTTNLFIEEAITGFTLSSNVYAVEPDMNIILKLTTVSGSNLVFNIDMDNGQTKAMSLKNNYRGPMTTYIPISYSSFGKFNVSVTVSNSLSSVKAYLNSMLFVENPIQDTVISADAVTAIPPGNVNVYLKYNGVRNPPCHMTCHVIIQNFVIAEFYIDVLTPFTTKTLVVKWDKTETVGQEQITLNCSNRINSGDMQAWTTFQKPVEFVSVKPNMEFVPVDGSVEFTFRIGAGSHVKYSYDLGNGVPVDDMPPTTLVSNFSTLVQQSYHQFGIFTITFTASNLVSSIETGTTITVLQAVTGLKVERYYTISDVSYAHNYGHGVNADVFPMERTLTFQTSLVTGNDITYHWSFGDGTNSSTKESTKFHLFAKVGDFDVIVTASNALYQQTKTIPLTIQKIVVPYSLSNDGPKRAYDAMNFTLRLAEPGTNPCYLWDMGDNSKLTIYGGSDCEAKASLNDFNYFAWGQGVTLYHTHMYIKNGSFTARVTAFNTVSIQTISNIAVISGVSCFYPEVHINGGGQRFDRPVSKLRSEWINLESTAVINCDVSIGPSYQWKIYKITQGNTYLHRIYTEYDISNTVALDKFKILFPPGSFADGIYRLSLNVSMIGIPGLFQEGFTYLNISKTPLVVSIIGGSARSIGYDKILNLNAIAATYDPDVDDTSDKSGFTFEWRCRLLGESFPTVVSTISVPLINETVNMTHAGGCFGTGIGRIPITQGTFDLTTKLFQPGSKNVLEVIARKDTRETRFIQVIDIVAGDPQQLNIR